MPFGKKLKNSNSSRSLMLRLYFIIGSIIILLFFILYTNFLLKSAREEARIVPNLFARFMNFSGSENFDQLLAQYIFEEVIIKIDYPIIVTDDDSNPLYWKNLEIDETKRIDDLDAADTEKLMQKLKKMIRGNHKIELKYNAFEDKTLGYVYYDEPSSLKQLQYVPYLEMILILVFVLFGFYGIVFLKRSEKNMIWMGLAKETAHQFGTPITSLLGWIDLLESRFATLDDSVYLEMLENMKIDIEQLRKVAFRFGKVGSSITLQTTDLIKTINDTIVYFQKRLPSKENEIVIHMITKLENRPIKVDEDLIKWTLENMIKNCIDAMHMKGGNIFITIVGNEKHTSILIKDEGKGIPKSNFQKIFEPGITSKERGWGLGLSLAKRIVEEFHHGKIRVLESNIGEGTTFEILLPNN